MEERMAYWFVQLAPLRKELGIAESKFLKEMLPLVVDLPATRRNRCHRPHGPDLAPIERITAHGRFRVDGRQISIDRQARRCVGLEAFKLRVMLVPPRFAAKYGARQQSLAP